MHERMLQILSTGYRGTLEQQDDTVLWLAHSLRNKGADLDVLLCGTAVNYAVRAQRVRGLAIGDWQQTQPPDLAYEIRALIAKGCSVFVLADDAKARGIRRDEMLESIGSVARAELPALLRRYKRVWRW